MSYHNNTASQIKANERTTRWARLARAARRAIAAGRRPVQSRTAIATRCQRDSFPGCIAHECAQCAGLRAIHGIAACLYIRARWPNAPMAHIRISGRSPLHFSKSMTQMTNIGHGRALLNGQPIISRDAGPFKSSVERIVWVLPPWLAIRGLCEWDTRTLRLLGHTLEIVYAPRARPIVPFAGIASSLADIEQYAPGSFAGADEGEE